MIVRSRSALSPRVWIVIPMLLAACGSEPVAPVADPEPIDVELRTKTELEVLGLHLRGANACSAVEAELQQSDWDEDARLRLDLMLANCGLPLDDITAADAEAALGDENIAIIAEGDALTIYQRTKGNEAFFCCSLQGLPSRAVIGDTVWVARQRLRSLDEATITMSADLMNVDPEGYDIKPSGLEGEAVWRGANVLELLEPIEDGLLQGTVTEHEIYSPQLEETRRILVYTPPGIGLETPVIIVADGSTFSGEVERLIRDGEIDPVLVVGIRSGQDGIVEDRSAIGDTNDLRSYDYIPGELWAERGVEAGAVRFDQHLAFVTETMLEWVGEEFGVEVTRERTVVAGWSNGGSFALNAAFRRNEVFGHAWPMSVGLGSMNEPQEPPAGPRALFRFSAGHYEPGFMLGTRASLNSLSALGYETDAKWYAEGHGFNQWHARFVENLQAVFPAED